MKQFHVENLTSRDFPIFLANGNGIALGIDINRQRLNKPANKLFVGETKTVSITAHKRSLQVEYRFY